MRKNRAVIDASRKGVEDGHPWLWPADILMSREIKESIKKRIEEPGFL